MKVTIPQKSLLAALDPVRRVVEKRNTIPILANVELRAHAGDDLDPATLMLTGTDLDRELSVTIPASVEIAGSTTVPAHLLYDIVRKLPSSADVNLSVNAEGTQMTVASGRSNFRLQCLPAEDFPELNQGLGQSPTSFSLTSDDVRSLLGRTSFAMSTEETRYYLNGVNLHVRDDVGLDEKFLCAVATCGHRLAVYEAKAPEGSEGMPAEIIPAATLEEILKLVGKGDEEVGVRISDRGIEVTVGDVELYSKLIDGTYPDYRRVIPINNDQNLRIDRAALAAAVDRVATVSSERGRGVTVELGQSSIRLSVTAPDAGTASEELDASYDGQPFEIGFNSKYLSGILGHFTDDEIEIALGGPGSPSIIRGDDSLTVVLMPMRV